MLESPRHRAVALAALLAGLFALAVWFGSMAPAPALGDYPNAAELDAASTGDTVEVSGPVVATDPVVVEAEDGGGTTPVVLHGVAAHRGDHVWAAGELEGNAVAVADAVVVPPRGFLYAYGVSLLAGLWVLARVVRDWRFDREAVGLAPDGGDDGA